MRLICPNCDAEYEVDHAAIPDGGRDVQCSNCGHGWFQFPASFEAEQAEEEALFGPDAGEMPSSPEIASAEPPVAARRTLDEGLMAILREEAEREAAARRAEAAPIETQTEMPLAAPPVSDASRRIARLKGIDPDAPPPPAGKPGSRRKILPDIEEITSSLRSSSAQADHRADDAPPARNGFRNGFTLSLLIAATAAGTYSMAPRLAEQLPAAAPLLQSYVAQVDMGRLWLDSAMRRATAAIHGVTDASGG